MFGGTGAGDSSGSDRQSEHGEADGRHDRSRRCEALTAMTGQTSASFTMAAATTRSRAQRVVWLGLLWTCLAFMYSSSTKADDGFVPLFNGRDLDGWINVNGQPETWHVQNGELASTGEPIGFLRTERMYQNFVLEFEWLHEPRNDDKEGNSGLFVWADPLPAPGQGEFARAVEVQVLVGLEWHDKNSGAVTASSHGDVFSIWGMHCTPDRPHPRGWERSIPGEFRAKGFGEWNHYRVTARDGEVRLAVNGKEVARVHDCSLRKGHLALEAEGNPVRFRDLRIRELPGGDLRPEQVALDGHGWQRLYNGRDLAGWKAGPGHVGHWQAVGWRLIYDGKSEAADPSLWTEREYGDFELVVDWRLTGARRKSMIPVVLPSGEHAHHRRGGERKIEIDDYGDSGLYLRGSDKAQVNIWSWPIGSGEVYGYRADPKMPPEVRAATTPKVKADAKPGEWNRFYITLRGDRLSVRLNGQSVIDNAQLPGLPERGPIALQHYGDPVEFANLYLRELAPDGRPIETR